MENRSVHSLLVENQQAYLRREEEIRKKMQGASSADILIAICEDPEYRRLGFNEKRLIELEEIAHQLEED